MDWEGLTEKVTFLHEWRCLPLVCIHMAVHAEKTPGRMHHSCPEGANKVPSEPAMLASNDLSGSLNSPKYSPAWVLKPEIPLMMVKNYLVPYYPREISDGFGNASTQCSNVPQWPWKHMANDWALFIYKRRGHKFQEDMGSLSQEEQRLIRGNRQTSQTVLSPGSVTRNWYRTWKS